MLKGAEFVLDFYEKLPEFLLSGVQGKTNAKDYKRLKGFLQSAKNSLKEIKDEVSLHGASEQKRFIDAYLSLTEIFLTDKRETEDALIARENAEYALFVWKLLSPIPKKIRQLKTAPDKASSHDYYAIEQLFSRMLSCGPCAAFYEETFITPTRKIQRAADAFLEQYTRLSTSAAQESTAFTATLAQSIQKMCRDYTLLNGFIERLREMSVHTFVVFMNNMPSVVFDILENTMTKKQLGQFTTYIKSVEKLCKVYGWRDLVEAEITLPVAEEAPALEEEAPVAEEATVAEEAPVEEVAEEAVEEAPATEAPEEEVSFITEDAPATVEEPPILTEEATAQETTGEDSLIAPVAEEADENATPCEDFIVDASQDFEVEITSEPEESTEEGASEDTVAEENAEDATAPECTDCL